MVPNPSTTEKRTVIPKAMLKIFAEQPFIVSLKPYPGLIPVAWETIKNAAALKMMLESKEITEKYELILVEK